MTDFRKKIMAGVDIQYRPMQAVEDIQSFNNEQLKRLSQLLELKYADLVREKAINIFRSGEVNDQVLNAVKTIAGERVRNDMEPIYYSTN